jgi:glycosyltransferase involved in cell wall biosynthesis
VTPERALAFLACPPEHAGAALTRLVAERPASAWDVVTLEASPRDWPRGMRRLPATASAAFAARLWLRALASRYASVVVCAADVERLDPLRPLLAYVALLPVRDRRVVDRLGATRTLDAAGPRAIAAALLTPWLLALARVVTRIGLAVVRPATPPRPRGDGTAILVPVLPDLSHTFVYREALALVRRRPDWQVLVLERGAPGVLHRDAEALARVAREVPRLTPVRYLLAYLRHWLARPRAMAGTIRAVRPHAASFPGLAADDPFVFLSLAFLDHSNHVAQGLVLAEHLLREGIGAVHVYGATYPALRAVVAHRLLGVRMSLSTFVDYEVPTPFHMLADKLEAARFVAVCSDHERARLGARYPALDGRLRVVRPSLPADHGDAPEFRAPDGRSRIVFVGRFVPKKGLATLVAAVARLRARGVATSCHLHGAGEEEPALQALVARLGLDAIVRFEGPIPNQAFYRVMRPDDVFVCAAREMPDGDRDGIPVALIEAMAAGLTVVATRISGIPELIEDGVNGHLVTPGDADALADVLARLLGSAEERAKVAAAARRTVRERFSLDVAADALARWISRETSSRAGDR